MNKRLNALIVAIACILMLPMAAFAQLPTPTYGWNIGNTMEPPSGEGTWNNPPVTQAVISAIADAGFNTIRIPVAWDSHANPSTYEIDPAWLARVQEVVDWCLAENLHVIVNSHWDNGWFDNNGFRRFDSNLNDKFAAYWTQIANTFVNHDSRLLLCAANEPDADTQKKTDVLLQYYQTFVNAVRATGGQNTSRWLILPGPFTNIDSTFDYMNSLPTDPTPGRLMIDVHYYDPFNFALMTEDATWGNMFYFWGQGYHHSTRTDRNPTWGEEDWLLDQFGKMNTKFVSQGVPVLVGEFGAIQRTGYADLSGEDFDLHLAARTYFNKQIVDTANSLGLLPVYWDNGDPGTNGFALIDRNTATVIDPDGVASLTGGPALPPLPGPDPPPPGSGSGTILREWWLGISGGSVSDLTGNANYPDNPSGSEQLDSFEGPTNWADSYGSRIIGTVHPPATGDYTFWIAGDDSAELWIGTNDQEQSAIPRASVPAWTNSREWTKYPEQQSAPISMIADQAYFIMAIQKENTGGDNLAVAWEVPGFSLQVIDGEYLSPYEGSTPCTSFTVSVSAITVSTVSVGQGFKIGQAAVTVVDGCGNPIAGAMVTGDFTGNISESGASGVTNASGLATIQTNGSAKGNVSVTFCVTNVAASGLTYNASANVETCDSN